MILAIDTALSATSACILAPGQSKPVAAETLFMEAGHAEALLPLVDRVIARLPGGFKALSRIALMSAEAAARALGGGPLRLIGSGGSIIAAAAYALGVTTDTEGFHPLPDIDYVARLGALADPETALARPFYLKAPDAKPPAASGLLQTK